LKFKSAPQKAGPLRRPVRQEAKFQGPRHARVVLESQRDLSGTVSTALLQGAWHIRLTRQIHPAVFHLKRERLIEPLLPMIMVIACRPRIPEKKSTPNGPSHRVNDGNLFRSKISTRAIPLMISASFLLIRFVGTLEIEKLRLIGP